MSAASIEMTAFRDRNRQPGDAGALLVDRDGEQRPQERGHHDERPEAEQRDREQVAAGDGQDRPEQVGDRFALRAPAAEMSTTPPAMPV